MGWVKISRVKIGWVKMGLVKIDWVKMRWVKIVWVKMGWMKIGWVKMGWMKTGRVKMGWVKLGRVKMSRSRKGGVCSGRHWVSHTLWLSENFLIANGRWEKSGENCLNENEWERRCSGRHWVSHTLHWSGPADRQWGKATMPVLNLRRKEMYTVQCAKRFEWAEWIWSQQKLAEWKLADWKRQSVRKGNNASAHIKEKRDVHCTMCKKIWVNMIPAKIGWAKTHRLKATISIGKATMPVLNLRRQEMYNVWVGRVKIITK